MITETRNSTLHDLARLLTEQHGRKIDLVAPASAIRFIDGELVLTGVEPQIETDGVTDANDTYNRTSVFDEGLADKLGIPLPYLRRIGGSRADLFDANVNGWLQGSGLIKDGSSPLSAVYPGDSRSFLLRLFRGDEGPGIARAFLSNGYRLLDDLDVMTAALQGITDAGVTVEVAGCDLSERRMSIRIISKEIAVHGRSLVKGYRSPYSGLAGEDLPLVFAGFVIANSETGGGAFSITPRVVFQVCSNGLTIAKDVLRQVHLGGRMDDGLIQWSADTQQKAVELVTARTRDAVRTFLSPGYLEGVVAEAEVKAGHEVPVMTAIQTVGKRLQFDEATIAGVLEAFMRSGQPTAGGVMQAITAYAGAEENPDKAAALEAAALPALELAAAL